MTRWKADVRFCAAPATSADVFDNNCRMGLNLRAQRATGSTACQSTIQDLLASLAMRGQRFFGTWSVHKECSAIRPRLSRPAAGQERYHFVPTERSSKVACYRTIAKLAANSHSRRKAGSKDARRVVARAAVAVTRPTTSTNAKRPKSGNHWMLPDVINK